MSRYVAVTGTQLCVLLAMRILARRLARYPTVREITSFRRCKSMQGQRLLLLELERKGLVIRPKHTRDQWRLSRAGLAFLEGGS